MAFDLSLASGKRLAEHGGNAAQFTPTDTGFPLEALVGNDDCKEPTTQSCQIPLLCGYQHFIEGVKKLRDMKKMSYLTPAEVNHRYSKLVNLSVRKLLGNACKGGHVFAAEEPVQRE